MQAPNTKQASNDISFDQVKKAKELLNSATISEEDAEKNAERMLAQISQKAFVEGAEAMEKQMGWHDIKFAGTEMQTSEVVDLWAVFLGGGKKAQPGRYVDCKWSKFYKCWAQDGAPLRPNRFKISHFINLVKGPTIK